MRLKAVLLIVCLGLTVTTVHAVENLELRTSSILNKKANVGVPNCMGATMYAMGFTGGPLFSDMDLDAAMALAECKVVNDQPQLGDIGLVRFTGFRPEGFNQHSVVFLDENRIFEKKGTDQATPYEVVKLEDLCSSYPIYGLCNQDEGHKHQVFERYRCDMASFDSKLNVRPTVSTLQTLTKGIEEILSKSTFRSEVSLSREEIIYIAEAFRWIAQHRDAIRTEINSDKALKVFFLERVRNFGLVFQFLSGPAYEDLLLSYKKTVVLLKD